MRQRQHRSIASLMVIVLVVIVAVMLTGCGGGKHASHVATSSTRQITLPAPAPTGTSTCPQAAGGHGSPGACAPKTFGLTAPGKTAPHLPTFPDRSNNDPCYCGASIKAAGQVGLIVKANQGLSYIDSTAVGMVDSARAAGLAVGEYDFDQDYTVAEIKLFVARMHAAGIYPTTPNTFPATIDVEYGSFSYAGLVAQVAYLRAQGYRVQIYTGEWYYGPHAGCRWIAGVFAWLSGYPSAPVPCGTTGYLTHQYTSTPLDLSVFLGNLTSFHTFVHAVAPKPKPSPFSIFVLPRVTIYGQRVSERLTVMSWWANHCANPVRRQVCRSTRTHLVWLHGRLYSLALAAGSAGDSRVDVDWTPDHWGARYYRIGRILASR